MQFIGGLLAKSYHDAYLEETSSAGAGGGPAGGIGEWTWRTRARPARGERLSEGRQARVSERPSMAEVSSPVDVVPRRGATTARQFLAPVFQFETWDAGEVFRVISHKGKACL